MSATCGKQRGWTVYREGTYHREALLIHLPRQLQMHAPQDGSLLRMDLHRPCDLMDDVLEMTCLEGRVLRRLCVSVHRVGAPDDSVWGGRDLADVGGEVLIDLVGSVPGDERDLAVFVGGVEN